MMINSWSIWYSLIMLRFYWWSVILDSMQLLLRSLPLNPQFLTISDLATELSLPLLLTPLILSLLLNHLLPLNLLLINILQKSSYPRLPILIKIFLLHLVNISNHNILHLLFIFPQIVVFKINVRKTHLVRINLFNNLIWYFVDLVTFECLYFTGLYSFLYR